LPAKSFCHCEERSNLSTFVIASLNALAFRRGNLGSYASPFPLSLRGALATKQSRYEIATPAFGGLAMTDFWGRPIVIARSETIHSPFVIASLNASAFRRGNLVFREKYFKLKKFEIATASLTGNLAMTAGENCIIKGLPRPPAAGSQ
jgi:hypothetical protein